MWGALRNILKLTFFRLPLDVPRNATVCRSVVAMETEVSDVLGKCMAAWLLIGATPEIFNPTSQKFNMLPVSWKEKKIQVSSNILLDLLNVRNVLLCQIKLGTTRRSYSIHNTYIYIYVVTNEQDNLLRHDTNLRYVSTSKFITRMTSVTFV